MKQQVETCKWEKLNNCFRTRVKENLCDRNSEFEIHSWIGTGG